VSAPTAPVGFNALELMIDCCGPLFPVMGERDGLNALIDWRDRLPRFSRELCVRFLNSLGGDARDEELRHLSNTRRPFSRAAAHIFTRDMDGPLE
jgi:hypothetical protein